jgi:hypothetical protein
MAEKQPESFLEAIQRGSFPNVQESPVVVATPKQEKETGPSAIGGLAAFGATVLGATALGRRVPAIRNFFRTTSSKPALKEYVFNKPMATGNMPTATGQAEEIINVPSKALVAGKSRFGEVLHSPLGMGKPLKEGGPLFGSSAYDRALEAPFDKAPAGQWIKWFQNANRGDLVYPGGPLQGVSRKVSPEELSELNLVNFKDNKPISGFLKTAEDAGIPVDRESILKMIKASPINHIKTIRLTAGKDPVGDIGEVRNLIDEVSKKIPIEQQTLEGLAPFNPMFTQISKLARKMGDARSPIAAEDISYFQDALKNVASKFPDSLDVQTDLKNILVQFNKATGKYNSASAVPPSIQGHKDLRSYYPKNKDKRSYHLDGGENFSEDIIFYDGPLPKVRGSKFKYVEGEPHYLTESRREIAFARYDDLPNPKLGEGKRHIRVSEVQSDLHSPQFSPSKSNVTEYFQSKVVPFNQDANLSLLQGQRKELIDKITPYKELGRGRIGLTKSQTQELNQVEYKLNQLDKSAMSSLIKQGTIESTTAGPFSRSYNDLVIKNLLRSMAERKVNAISIVPASMNQNIKMFDSSKFGNELNYGLKDGKAMIRGKDGQPKKLNNYSSLNESLNRAAKQYGAKFELFPMPKSNPNKTFKVIEEISTNSISGYREAVQAGRAQYNTKIGNDYVFANHVGAGRTKQEAEMIKFAYQDAGSTKGKLVVREILPDSPDNYEMVPTFIADDNVLKKFLLPQKAYLNEGGFVETTNIFKSIL